MNAFFTYIAIILAWLLSFVEPSGWGQVMHLSDKINWLIVALSIGFWLLDPLRRQKIQPWIFWGLIITFILIPYIRDDSLQGASYLTSFLVVYIFSQARVTSTIIKYTGIAIAGMGLVIMWIYTRGSILSGWNDNAISMVGLFSYIYFAIFLIQKKDDRSFWTWNIVTIIYLWFLFSTECRSGMIFSVLTVVAIIWLNKTKYILSNKRWDLLLLNVPLIVAIVTIMLSETSIYESLDEWSTSGGTEFIDPETGMIRTRGAKPLFNQRHLLWQNAFDLLVNSNFIGTGTFQMNYHNSCIACLSVFGILGYICWIFYFQNIIKQYIPYFRDIIVVGCLIAFFMIYLQQSFDLGFISPNSNRLPYMILGLGLARIYNKNHNFNPYLN